MFNLVILGTFARGVPAGKLAFVASMRIYEYSC
jgi:hypothetical protein